MLNNSALVWFSMLKGVNDEEHGRCMFEGQGNQVTLLMCEQLATITTWTHTHSSARRDETHTFKGDLWGSEEQLKMRHWTMYDRSMGMSLWLLRKAPCSYHNSEWWRVWLWDTVHACAFVCVRRCKTSRGQKCPKFKNSPKQKCRLVRCSKVKRFTANKLGTNVALIVYKKIHKILAYSTNNNSH